MNHNQVFFDSYNRFLSKGELPFFLMDIVDHAFERPTLREIYSPMNEQQLRSRIDFTLNSIINYSVNGLEQEIFHSDAQYLLSYKTPITTRPELFGIWSECILEVVPIYDTKFDETIKRSWITALKPGVDLLKYYFMTESERMAIRH